MGVTKSTSRRVGGRSGDENPSEPILRLRREGASSKSDTASRAREGRVRRRSEGLLRVELEGTRGGEETKLGDDSRAIQDVFLYKFYYILEGTRAKNKHRQRHKR